MKDRINLIVNCPNALDATSLYRGMGPLLDLQKDLPQLNLITHVQEYSWMIFKMADAIFLQRPHTDKHLSIIQMAKKNNVPVWVDYDDDLFTVPVSNPAYKYYSTEYTMKTMAKIIASADVVTVSTEFLKKQLQRGASPLNKNIKVVPNSFDSRLFNYRKQPTTDRKKMILWRGSSTHQKDLADYMEQIVPAVNSDKSWTWWFQGDKPWFLFEKLGDNALFAESVDPIEYFEQIHEVKPPVMIVPLHDCEFNKSKSNIAWIEAAFFGAMTIAPAWDEWRRPGCINYRDQAHFGEIIKQVMQGKWDPNVESAKAWDYIQANLLLRDVNKLRQEVLENLIERK